MVETNQLLINYYKKMNVKEKLLIYIIKKASDVYENSKI